MAIEGHTSICDTPPVAQLVDCAAPEPEVLSVDVSASVDESPTRQAMDATVEQTGAGPPPADGVAS
jgi:hypothetical protein